MAETSDKLLEPAEHKNIETQVYRALIEHKGRYLLMIKHDEKNIDTIGGRPEPDDKNETLEQTLSREIASKTGIKISAEKIVLCTKRDTFEEQSKKHKYKKRIFTTVLIHLEKDPGKIIYPSTTYDGTLWLTKEEALAKKELRGRARRALKKLG